MRASLVAQWWKYLPVMQERWGDPSVTKIPGEGNGNPLQYLAWKTPWTKEPGGLQSMGSQRVGHNWATSLHFTSVYSYHLFLISSASVRSLPFLSFIGPIFAGNVPLVSLILLKRSLVFPILLFSSIPGPLVPKQITELLLILPILSSDVRCVKYSVCAESQVFCTQSLPQPSRRTWH